MPTAKELTIRIEDRPGTLGKACRALADLFHGVEQGAIHIRRDQPRFLHVSYPAGSEHQVRPL